MTVTDKTEIKSESLTTILLTKRLFGLSQIVIPKEFNSFTNVGTSFNKKIPKAKKVFDQYICPGETETEYHNLNIDEPETGYKSLTARLHENQNELKPV